MNEILLDQLPSLSFLLRTLEELSIMNVKQFRICLDKFNATAQAEN